MSAYLLDAHDAPRPPNLATRTRLGADEAGLGTPPATRHTQRLLHPEQARIVGWGAHGSRFDTQQDWTEEEAMKACSSKVRYPTKLSSLLAMARISAADKRSFDEHEQRTYRCPHCRGYHLTSQAKRGEGTWRP